MIVTTADFDPVSARALQSIDFGTEYEYIYGTDYGDKTPSGVKINHKTAMYNSSWWRGLNLVATSVAKLEINVEQRSGRGWSKANAHPAWRLLRQSPCEYLTPIQFILVLQFHALDYGNGYAYIVRDANEEPVEMYPLDPSSVEPFRKNGRLWYKYASPVNETQALQMPPIAAPDMLHVRGMGFDGLCGYSLRQIAKESLGWSLAMSRYGSRYFANNARPNLAIKTPPTFTKQQRDETRAAFESLHRGVDNAHKTALLSPGCELVEYGGNAQESQLNEALAFTRKEIANYIGVPSHKVGDDANRAYASLEQSNQEYLDDCIDFWLVNWEQELQAKLLSESEKRADSHRIQFDRTSLLRADATSRSALWQSGIQNSWVSPDEVRAREGFEPRDDGKGGEYLQPLNMLGTANRPAVPAGSATTLNATAKAVSAGEMTPDAAKIALKVEFPNWPEAEISAFCDALEVKEVPKTPQNPPANEPVSPENPPESAPKNEDLQRSAGELLDDAVRRCVYRINDRAIRNATSARKFGEFIGSIETEHRELFALACEPVDRLCRALGHHGDQKLHEWLLRTVADHWNIAADQYTPAELPARASEHAESLVADAVRAARTLFLEN